MRPSLLYPLFAPLGSLRGVGPKLATRYEKLIGPFIAGALWHLPTGVIDRRYRPRLIEAKAERVATLTLEIEAIEPPSRAGRPVKIVATDGTDQIALTYFNVKGDYLTRLYPVGRKVAVSGKLERFGGAWTMSHPDYALPAARVNEIPALEPVYPLTEGIGGKRLRAVVAEALSRLPAMPEWHDPALLTREGWPSLRVALDALHNPTQPFETIDESPARRRLAYDEILADQLVLALIRRQHKTLLGHPRTGDGSLTGRLRTTLPFALTPGQEQAIAEIATDMASDARMLRLLQGDVGSGKTIVALFAMLQAVEAGFQAALMAPTEILAKQAAERLAAFTAPLGLPVGLLVGKGNGKRKPTLEALADGSLSLVVGTHALFQEDVAFARLGLAIVDEQHRFGVHQRLMLSDKGQKTDVLVMTATPIPRTLTLTAYGDMDVSRLLDKPPGRQPIATRIIDLARLDEVIAGVGRQLEAGAQVYWVCPLVEESEKSDLAAVTARAAVLAERFGAGKVGLIHGRLKPAEKDKIMAAFAAGETRLLVATTVIEVGVDVPAATLMIIEHAERFGLAALHQLRGRVGRGRGASTCLLLYQNPLSENGKARLTRLRDTEDGFALAEEDLRLRGPGEVLGVRQSGLPGYRMANLLTDQGLIQIAHDDAQVILARDPTLDGPRGQALRNLLYLFNKDAVAKLLRAG
jgi:ATP-dependent DNA helicase RecG